MRTHRGRLLGGTGLLLTCAVLFQQCTSKAAPSAADESTIKPIVTIKELMENIIDPIADNVFDAVGVDVSVKGVVETKPVTDDDWAKVRQGAVTLAEGSNLLKMHRPVAPPGTRTTATDQTRPSSRPSRFSPRSTGIERCGTSMRTNSATKPSKCWTS